MKRVLSFGSILILALLLSVLPVMQVGATIPSTNQSGSAPTQESTIEGTGNRVYSVPAVTQEISEEYVTDAEMAQYKRNRSSVLILVGFAVLIMLVVGGKLFYDRVIGPKIDEIESGAPKKSKKKKNANQVNDIDEDDADGLHFASISDDEDDDSFEED